MSILGQIKDPAGTLASIINQDNEKSEGPWTPLVRDDNTRFAEMAALIPHGYHFTTDIWLETVFAIFEEYPRISGRTKLRLIFQRAADEGSKLLVGTDCFSVIRCIDCIEIKLFRV